ncbi:hypothetical protein [Streptomyces sp. CBMA29]|uniref:hypothetical protein n=1 Tax=Streptomyces sp. CBMA29 TaxID=1896314 RepID=UPI001661B2FA|nr:hypothetical protein [Streptomyces sp. CBMA29]MBD0734087.1 hypothetical protein [Streptomyces sp. CBMA29]
MDERLPPLRADVYPGTTRPVGPPAARTPEPGDVNGWDAHPTYQYLQGARREFYGIGHLALAICRSTKTIYKWEARGHFPRATFILNGSSKNGRRRLYTRQQITGVIEIAVDEGILTGHQRFIGNTQFPARCAELFQRTRSVLPPPIADWTHDA